MIKAARTDFLWLINGIRGAQGTIVVLVEFDIITTAFEALAAKFPNMRSDLVVYRENKTPVCGIELQPGLTLLPLRVAATDTDEPYLQGEFVSIIKDFDHIYDISDSDGYLWMKRVRGFNKMYP